MWGGACAFHLTAGVFAAVAAWLVGARRGKYNHDGSANAIPGHSVPLGLGGVTLMVVGWIAYLVGAAYVQGANLERAALGALEAAAAGTLVAALYGRLRFSKPDVFLTASGTIGALVAITASAGVVGGGMALIVGAVAGFVVPWTLLWIDLHLRLDDPAGVIAIQGVGAVWGALAAGLLVNVRNMGIQVIGVVSIAAFAFLVAVVALGAIKRFVPLRINEEEEYDGLDLAEHDINAYPDFPQNMIKSYELREL